MKTGRGNHSKLGSMRISVVGTKPYQMIKLDPLEYPEITTYTGWAFNHRYIMREHLGRPLEKGESVYHIDGDSMNNDISNLELMSRTDALIRSRELRTFEKHKYTTKCHTCNKDIIRNGKNPGIKRAYCNSYCRYKNTLMELACDTCGITFEKRRSYVEHIKRRKNPQTGFYCSRKCAGHANGMRNAMKYKGKTNGYT